MGDRQSRMRRPEEKAQQAELAWPGKLAPSRCGGDCQRGSASGQVQEFATGKFHAVSSIKHRSPSVVALADKWIQIRNARQPLALTLPMKSMGIRHVPFWQLDLLSYRSLTLMRRGRRSLTALNVEKRRPLTCRHLGGNRTRYTHFEFCRSWPVADVGSRRGHVRPTRRGCRLL